MKKTFLLNEIDCPNCASKFESAVQKINGVNAAAVNFFAQKLIVELDADKEAQVCDEIVKVLKKTLSGVEIKPL